MYSLINFTPCRITSCKYRVSISVLKRKEIVLTKKVAIHPYMFILPQKGGEEGAQSGGVAVEVEYTEANLEEKLKRFSIWTSHQLELRMLIMLILGSRRKHCNISPHLKTYDNKYGLWSVSIIAQLLCSRKRYFCKCHFAFRHLLTCPVQLSKFEIHIQQIDR